MVQVKTAQTGYPDILYINTVISLSHGIDEPTSREKNATREAASNRPLGQHDVKADAA